VLSCHIIFSAVDLEAFYRRDDSHFADGETQALRLEHPDCDIDIEKQKKITFSDTKSICSG